MGILVLSSSGGRLVLRVEEAPVDPGEETSIAEVALSNTAEDATPAATFYPFGHPFKQGDVPVGSAVSATWTPSGGEAVAAPLQISSRSTWPDGSLRFATCLVKLPAVADSGTGALSLSVASGAQDESLPVAATVASVLAELRANHSFAAAAANLTKGYVPSADGSGSWTWAADANLALFDDVDSRGRVRCEAIESGPLAVTFKCWGPFVDNTGGASHPHLCVFAWYRCWLAGDGTIDRVEHFHSLDQGWIEDLAGGTAKADLQIGDFAVKRNGSTVSGLSWTGLRIAHHTMNALTTIASDGSSTSELTGGSTWTSGTPTLFAAFDAAYWNATGLVGPYDLSVTPLASTDTSPAQFSPGATATSGKIAMLDTTGGRAERAINGTGDKNYHGMLPKWDVSWFYTQEQSWARSCLCTALAAGAMPLSIRDPSTGRIPIIINTATYADPGAARMGTNRPTLFYVNNFPGALAAAIRLEARAFGPNGGTDHTGTEAGWPDAFDMSHHPSLLYTSQLRTGQPWFAERSLALGNAPLMRLFGSSPRNMTLPSGAAPDGAFILKGQKRSEGWSWKMLLHGLVACPDTRIEKAYLQEVYDINAAAAAHEAASAPDSAKTLGTWHLKPVTATGFGAYLDYETPPWMEDFVAAPRASGKLAMGAGADSEADTAAWLSHYAKFLGGRGGAEAGFPCSWQAGNYHLLVGAGTDTTSYFSWADMPSYTISDGVKFDATAQSTGWIVGNSSPSDSINGLDLEPGDRVMPYPGLSTGPPPAELTAGVWYYVADVNHTTHRIRISPNQDLSSPITAYSAPPLTLSGMSFRLDRCPVPTGASAGNYFAGGTGSVIGYAGNYIGTLRLFIVAGAIPADAAWAAAVESRYASYVGTLIPSQRLGSDMRWVFSPPA